MNEHTLKALNKSIAHWDAIAKGKDVSKGAENCALCKLFFYEKVCRGCPVMKETGMKCCNGTPYWAFEQASKDEKGRGRQLPLVPPKHKKLVRLALAERDFLISLLPEAK